MNEQKHNEKPEVYALRQNGENWQISRRDFLKAAGIGAAALGAGLGSGLAAPSFADDSLADFCKKVQAHEKKITSLLLSADGKYLLSISDGPSYDDTIIKCWDMETGLLVNTKIFKNTRRIQTARIDGKSCLMVSSYKTIRIVSVPDMDVSDAIIVSVDSEFKGNMIKDFEVDPDENLYVTLISNPDIIRIARTDDAAKYGSQTVIYTCRNNAPNLGRFLDESRLLVTTLLDFFILNVKDRTTETLNIPIKNMYSFYSPLSDKSRILVQDRVEEGADASYSLYSIKESALIWRRSLPGRDGGQVDIQQIVPTPDDNNAVLFTVDTNIILRLISMEDGAVIKEVDTGPDDSNGASLVAAADGSKIAAALGKSIIFYSLPDLEMIGCSADTPEGGPISGSEVTIQNQETGENVTVTLPCNSPIPDGAVCTCNCVARVQTKPEPTAVPTAVPTKAPCSCHSHSNGGGGSHYWHPN